MRLINRAGTISAGDTEQDISYGIEFNPFMASLLSDKLYTDKPTACWRELYANAHDESDDIKVQLPTYNDPVCVIWDNGSGLDQNELISLFCTYGASNKRDTNSKIGGFGVGSKVLFSYTDTFSASSVKDGVKTGIVCYKDDEGMPTARIIGHEASDEQSGTRIQWATTSYDAESFRASALEVFSRFEHKPQFLCNTTHSWFEEMYSFETNEWGVRHPDFSGSLKKTGSGVQIVMGGIAYPVSSNSLEYSKYHSMCESNIDIFAPIGAVQLAASREALSYDEKTTAYVSRRLDDMKGQALQMIEDAVASSPNWYEKELAREQIVSPVPFLKDNRRGDKPTEMSVYHEVKGWRSRGGNVPVRIKLDSDTNFLIDPHDWDFTRKFAASKFQTRPEGRRRSYGYYSHSGPDCVIRFPTGTTTPAGFTTRAAAFTQENGLNSFVVLSDETYTWCLNNSVPTDEIIVWDKEMHDSYKVESASTGYADYRRKKAEQTTLFEVRSSVGLSYLSVRELGILRRLDEDVPSWFLLTNNGDYYAADNPAVENREPEIGYLCASGNMKVHLIPKSYSKVLGGNFMNINKEKEKFDAYLKDKMSNCNMLDGYVRSQLRTKFRELAEAELISEHRVRNGIEALMLQDSWDVPLWFQRFTKVILENEDTFNAGKNLNVNKVRGDILVKKELDITTKRLYRKPLIFQVLHSINNIKNAEVGNLASKVSAYLK